MPKYCPKCGQPPAVTGAFIEGFCPTCYFTKHPLITLRHPPKAKACPRCQAYWSSGRWIYQEDTPIDEHVFNLICDLLDPLFAPPQPASFEVRILDELTAPITRIKELHVEITAQAQQTSHQETKVITVPLATVLCERCKRASGGYYEAILQVRTSTGKLTPLQEERIVTFLQERVAILSPVSLPLKITPTRGGIDITFIAGRLCRSLARELAAHFGLILGVSSKVTGRTREGKTQRRENYMVRFPPFQTGDVLTQNDRIYVIKGIQKGRYILIDLESEQRQVYTPKELAEVDGQSLNDQIHEYQVISATPGFLQLMSRHDYTIYDFPAPPFPIEVGSTLRAVLWKNQLYLIPPEIP